MNLVFKTAGIVYLMLSYFPINLNKIEIISLLLSKS